MPGFFSSLLGLTPQGAAISMIPLAVAIIFAIITMILLLTKQYIAGLFTGVVAGLIIYMSMGSGSSGI